MRLLCAGLFPALQRTLTLASFKTGTVNRVHRVTESVGGKAANAARVLKTLGADPLLFTFAGGNNRTSVERLLDAEGIAYRFVRTTAPVRLSQTLLTDGAGDFTELVEEGPALQPGDWERFLARFRETLTSDIAAAVVSGTVPPHAPADIYARMLTAANDTIPVILDTSGKALATALPMRPALVKINAAELLMTTGTGRGGRAGKTAIEAAAHLLMEGGAAAVGITRGGEDAWLVTPQRTRRFLIPRVAVVSTLGCGDAVNAGIAFALLQGRNLEEAFVFGLACGVSNAMHRLPGMVDPAQVGAIAARIIAEPRRSARRSAASPPA